MAAPHDHSTENVLRAVYAKQDRLEKSVASFQEDILNHFETLQQSIAALSIPSGIQSSLEKDLLSIDECRPHSYARHLERKAASQEEEKLNNPSTEKATHRERTPKRASNLSLAATTHITDVYDFAANIRDSDKRPPSWRALSYDETMRVRKLTKIMEMASFCSADPHFSSEDTSKCDLSLTSSDMRRTSTKRNSYLFNFVRHPFFQCLCGSMVIFNSMLVGITVEIDANHGGRGNDIWEILSHVCSIFFFVELLVRMMALGVLTFFLHAEDRSMNLFDTLLVLMSIVDIVAGFTKMADSSSFDMGQAFKTMRLMRILRIFRVLRFFHELSLMVSMILDCLTSLFWAIVLLMIIMYSFAVVITQRAASYRASHLDDSSIDLGNVERMFGTIPCTCYFLFQTMLGGVSWGIVSDTLLEFDMWSATMYFFYIAFTVLAVLNIITGIFVDNALETSRMQREFIVKREAKVKRKTLKELAKGIRGFRQQGQEHGMLIARLRGEGAVPVSTMVRATIGGVRATDSALR